MRVFGKSPRVTLVQELSKPPRPECAEWFWTRVVFTVTFLRCVQSMSIHRLNKLANQKWQIANQIDFECR